MLFFPIGVLVLTGSGFVQGVLLKVLQFQTFDNGKPRVRKFRLVRVSDGIVVCGAFVEGKGYRIIQNKETVRQVLLHPQARTGLSTKDDVLLFNAKSKALGYKKIKPYHGVEKPYNFAMAQKNRLLSTRGRRGPKAIR